MADKPTPEAEKKTEEAPKKKSPIKLIGIVGGLMLAEAAGVVFLIGAMGPKPQTAVADIQVDEHAQSAEFVEIPVVDERFQNMQTGRVWTWDIAVVLKIKSKNQEIIKSALEKRSAEVKEGISQIVRRAQHNHLKEPELTTLSRQLTAYLDKVFGRDAEGNSRIERVIIPKCKGLQLEN
jgi:flagellar basal body-associated protein FliL